MSLFYISLDILEKTMDIDISLTGTDYCNSKLSNKKGIHLFSIFQKNQQENHSLNNVFSKDFAFALKIVYEKFL